MTKEKIEEKLKIYLDKNGFNIPTFEDMVNFAQEVEKKAIKELEEENAELKKKCYKKAVKDYCKLEKENAELKAFRQDCVKLTEDNVIMARQRAETANQLTKAKGIIRQFLNDYPVITKELLDKLEQFIKNSEVEK